jgi:hypothetical protein
MSTVVGAWSGDWRERIRCRLHDIGCSTLTDFLRRRPSDTYLALADHLGKEDVAAVQLQQLQLDYAESEGTYREAAADALVRMLNMHVKRGWNGSRHSEFRRGCAFADWMGMISRGGMRPECEPLARTVWEQLKLSGPPSDWCPASVDDARIDSAFDIGWPL